MRGGKGEFRLFPAADAELVDPPVAGQLVAPPHHAGVAELRAQVVIPQVRMRVKVDDVQVRVFPDRRPHRAQRHQVLPADEEGQLAVRQDLPGLFLNVPQGRFRRAEAQLQVPAVKYADIRQVLILVGAVGFQAEAFVADGGRAEPRAGPETGGGIKGCAEHRDHRAFVICVAADKGFNVLLHASTSSSIFSR